MRYILAIMNSSVHLDSHVSGKYTDISRPAVTVVPPAVIGIGTSVDNIDLSDRHIFRTLPRLLYLTSNP